MGEYITFVDSDDWIEKEMYEKMMKVAVEYDCDLVMCDCIKDGDMESTLYSHEIREGFYNYQQLQNEYYHHLLMMENVEFPATISNWLCLFRQENTKGKLRYLEGIKYSEDLLFGAQMIYQARSFYYMKGEALYHYQIRNNSASHKYDNEAWADHVKLCNATSQYFIKINEEVFGRQIDIMWLYFIYNTVGETLKEPTLSFKEKLQISRKILSSDEAKGVFNRIDIKRLPISTKLKLRTLCYKYKIGLYLLIR